MYCNVKYYSTQKVLDKNKNTVYNVVNANEIICVHMVTKTQRPPEPDTPRGAVFA